MTVSGARQLAYALIVGVLLLVLPIAIPLGIRIFDDPEPVLRKVSGYHCEVQDNVCRCESALPEAETWSCGPEYACCFRHRSMRRASWTAHGTQQRSEDKSCFCRRLSADDPSCSSTSSLRRVPVCPPGG